MSSQTLPSKPGIVLHDTPTASPALLEALNSHLPFSLPVLRRIQFASKFPGVPGSTPSTHILHAFYDKDNEPGNTTLNSSAQGGQHPHPQPPTEDDADGEEYPSLELKRKHFTAAYLDLSRYPETQAWFYSTLEDFYPDETSPFTPTRQPTEEEKLQSDALTMAVLKRMYEISNRPYPHPQPHPAGIRGQNARKPQHKHTVLIGSLHETIRQRMLKMGVKMEKTGNVPLEVEWEFCNKWLFRVEELPDFAASLSMNGTGNGIGNCPGEDSGEGDGEDVDVELFLRPANKGTGTGTDTGNGNGNDQGDGGGKSTRIKIKFDKARREDVPLIRSRTSIDRKEETLLRLPSLVLRRVNPGKEAKEEEERIAWVFTALDGTLMTLHVEPPYRGLGLAKLIASKIMTEHINDYGPDGWGAADVFIQNTQSQGVCKAIGGTKWWTLSWAVVDLASVTSVV